MRKPSDIFYGTKVHDNTNLYNFMVKNIDTLTPNNIKEIGKMITIYNLIVLSLAEVNKVYT